MVLLLDRFRSKLYRTWKASNKARQNHAYLKRSSEDSGASEFTDISAKSSLDTSASILSVSTSTSVSANSLHCTSIHTDILQTNDEPMPQQAAEITTLIDLKKQKLSELEKRKSILDEQRKFLERQRQLLDEELEEMSGEIHMYRGVVGCNMRKMPPDLLSEIFEHYVADAESTCIGSATVLTHVCRTWRQVALSSPRLWTSLSIPHVSHQAVENVLRRLDQVKAATGLPLNFDITLRRLSMDMQDAEFEQLSLDFLRNSIAHIHRWKDFSLHCRESVFSSNFAFPDVPDSTTASALETLEISLPRSSFAESHIQWALTLVHAAPALRNLRLQVPELSPQVLSTLSLPHLESLTIEVPVISDHALLGLLKDAVPNLRVLKLRAAGLVPDDDSLSSMSMIVHPSLEIFELCVSHGASGETLAQFFDNLALPSAREVVLDIGSFPDDREPGISADFDSAAQPEDLEFYWPHDSFLGFLERASSSVTSLRLGFNPTSSGSNLWGNIGTLGTELEEEHVREYLELNNVAESLTTLHVKRDRPVWPELLTYLTFPPAVSSLHRPSIASLHSHAGPRLPKLENVALDIDPIFQVLPMREFVQSHWYDGPDSSLRTVSRLRSFVVTLCFPDIPNLELESSATERVFERITQSQEDQGKLDVVYRRRTYTMMPVDVPLVPSGRELTI